MYFASGSCTMVLPPSKRQKAPKTAWTLSPSCFSQSLRVQQVAPTVSPVGSVGASALCAEVSTGDPHPLQRRQKGLFNFDEARFSRFIDSLSRYSQSGISAFVISYFTFCVMQGQMKSLLSFRLLYHT